MPLWCGVSVPMIYWAILLAYYDTVPGRLSSSMFFCPTNSSLYDLKLFVRYLYSIGLLASTPSFLRMIWSRARPRFTTYLNNSRFLPQMYRQEKQCPRRGSETGADDGSSAFKCLEIHLLDAIALIFAIIKLRPWYVSRSSIFRDSRTYNRDSLALFPHQAYSTGTTNRVLWALATANRIVYLLRHIGIDILVVICFWFC